MRSRWLDIGQVLLLHLDQTSLVNKGFITWDETPNPTRILSGQDNSILPAWVANNSARFGSSFPLKELVIIITRCTIIILIIYDKRLFQRTVLHTSLN